MYLLDTNICIYAIKRKPTQVFDRLAACAIGDVAISSITLSELEYGVAKSRRPQQNHEALLMFVAPLEVLPYDAEAAAAYGRMRAHLESRGRRIGPLDELIASHALATSAILVTNNAREFRRVKGLRVENWAR